MHSLSAFLAKKDVQFSAKRYFVDAMGAMVYGLFATLLVGTILKTFGDEFHVHFLSTVVWPFAQQATGPAIALAIAYSLRAPQLVLFSSAVVGVAAYQLGGPLGVFLSSIIAVECGKLISKETRIDIVITPIVTVLIGILIAQFAGPSVQQIMLWLGQIIGQSTNANPILMGIVIAVLVGMTLTLPISSAALCLMLELDGLAAGAATAGCCAQMIGFATISFRENGIQGFLAQGLGTSMLQMPNIYKNWRIWIPPTLSAAILGPIATTVLLMENTALESGMGTCGLVGQIGTWNAMKNEFSTSSILLKISILHFILPAILAYIIYCILKKINWIRTGDLKIF